MENRNKDLKRLFAVSRGEYSDYSVLAVFEDEATADAWAKAMNEGDDSYQEHRVESMLMVKAGTVPYKETTWIVRVELSDNGTVKWGDPWSYSDWAVCVEPAPVRPRVRYVRAPIHKNKGGRLEVVGKSQEEVMKVANEKVMMWKAGSWGGPKHQEIVEN